MAPLTRSQLTTGRWIIGMSFALAVVLGIVALMVPLEVAGLIVPFIVILATFGAGMTIMITRQNRRP